MGTETLLNRELERQLQDAAWDGDQVTVARLLQNSGVDPAALYSAALKNAAQRGRCVELLLPVSDPKAHDSEALWMAARFRHGRCVSLLAPVSDVSGWADWQWNDLPSAMRTRISEAWAGSDLAAGPRRATGARLHATDLVLDCGRDESVRLIALDYSQVVNKKPKQ